MRNDLAFIFKELNQDQNDIVLSRSNLLVTACPGSGKTRVLTHKLAYEALLHSQSNKKIIAITYTNRAANEIKERLGTYGFEHSSIWTGTIHQFCLEFVIRPFSMFHWRLSKGYKIIDDYIKRQYVDEAISDLELNVSFYDRNKLNLKPDTDFNLPPGIEGKIALEYHKRLRDNGEIDFDLILIFAHRILEYHPTATQNIADVIRCIFVDEYQDTNELQYRIIGLLTKKNPEINAMFVGDTDQAIYTTLGGIAKELEEICEITGLKFERKSLNGCYRSTQKLVDFYSYFKAKPSKLASIGINASEKGVIILNKATTSTLDGYIATIIRKQLNLGVCPEDICVIAPQRKLLYPLNESMTQLLPGVSFNAPDISPIKPNDLDVFFKIAKIVFTQSGINVSRRKRVAKEILDILVLDYGVSLCESIDTLQLLQDINSIKPDETDGLQYYRDIVERLFSQYQINSSDYSLLYKAYEDFVDSVTQRIKRHSLSSELETFRRLFIPKTGITITTCHKIKGEEYDTVIAFGLLEGMIPHWDVIFDESGNISKVDEARKMLYVISSRAKKHLFLIAEDGRYTRSNNIYKPTEFLSGYEFPYDCSIEYLGL